MMTHYLKYLVVFNFYYLVLLVLGIGLDVGIYRFTGVNAGTLVNILVFFAALGAALRTGDGIFPHRLDASHTEVAADIRAHGVMLAAGFAAIALVIDLACHRALASAFGAPLLAISMQHLLLLLGVYALMALFILNYEQRDDAAA